MAEQRSRTGLILGGVALLLALLAAIFAKARAAIRGTTTAPAPAPAPSEIPTFIPPQTAGEAAASGAFETIEFFRVSAGAVRGFVMTDPDLSPKEGEAWEVHAFTALDTDGNAQGLNAMLIPVEQARIIDRSGVITLSGMGTIPGSLKLYPASGISNSASNDPFTDQDSHGATMARNTYPFYIPAKYVLLIVEINTAIAGAGRTLLIRLMFRRIRAGQNLIPAQKSGSATGGIGKWISSLGG